MSSVKSKHTVFVFVDVDVVGFMYRTYLAVDLWTVEDPPDLNRSTDAGT